MVTVFKWFFCLSKRLYKKWLFVLLILLIPLTVAALKISSTENRGFVQIAFVNNAGETGDKIFSSLKENSGIIGFTEYKDAKAAKAALAADKFDAVWILPENIENRIAAFVGDPDSDNYVAYIINREENLKNRLAAEKLSGAIYPIISRRFFLKCVRESENFDLSNLTDDEIYEYYDGFFNDVNLFKFAFPDDNIHAKESERNYLTSPLRGLLSAVTLLSGLAAAMLYISDRKKGVFDFTKNSNRVFIAFAFVLTAIINIGAFQFISTFVLGVNTSFLREAAIFFIFAVNSALFCTVLLQFIRSITYFAPVAVLLAVLDILICPIFFDFTVQRKAQFFFPNAYYINSVHNDTYLKYSLIYMAVLLTILSLFYLKRRKA
ncbi:MAG: hypothetical protein J5852_03570 [Clostridia bacterium]|nr:hypothetical protein [Clostridia bacterium]